MKNLKRKIYQKSNKQISIKSSYLLLFSSSFVIWQIGVIYFSGTTLSLFGRTPIPLTEEDTSLIIAAGYIISILYICFFPRKVVYAQRILLCASLAATALMLFPFPAHIVTTLFYTATFGCVFSIGGMASLAIHLFTTDTTWRDSILCILVGGIGSAILQNDLIPINFTVFTIFSLFLIFGLTLFHFLIPAQITIPYASRKNKIKHQKILFFGIGLLIIFSTLLFCFASSFAESVPHGVSVLFSSSAGFVLLLAFLRKKLNNRSIKVYSYFFMLAVAGFAVAFFSLQITQLQLAACVLLSLTVVLANLWIYFGSIAFQLYPTRFIGAMGAGIGFTLALFHAQLLTLLRNNLPLLYGVYTMLSVGLMLVYYFIEPYFISAWNHFSSKGKEKSPKKDPSVSEQCKDECPAFIRLSEQEKTLAHLIMEGYTESIIAKKMNITLNTQKSYRKNLYTKLDIHSKRELFELVNGK